MNQINDLPGDDLAGLDFDYSVWTPNTEITLCRVPWDNTYTDHLSPQGLRNIDTYINNLPHTDKLTYDEFVPVRMGEPISIPKPYNAAARYNYVRAVHPAKPVPGDDIPMTYYYFITGFVEDSANSTQVLLQLDLWATYGKTVKIKSAFVNRSHLPIAASNGDANYGRDYLTVPEGLDLGTNYITRVSADDQIFSISNAAVLVVSNVDLNGPYVDGAGNPIKRAARGSSFQRMPSGATFYVFRSADSFRVFMETISDYPHIAQGIMSVTLVPEFTAHYPGFIFNPAPEVTIPPSTKPVAVARSIYQNFRDALLLTLPEKYRHLKKFVTSPYCMIEFTSFNGSPLTLRPELWNVDNIEFTRMISYIPPQQRVVVIPNKYGGKANASAYAHDFLDSALVIDNFPTLPMVNDAGTLYLAQNAHGLAQGAASADWSREKATRGAQLSYDQASKNIDTSTAAMEQGNSYASTGQQISQDYAVTEALLGGVQGIGQGALGGATAGPGGAAVGAGMSAVGAAFNGINTAVQISKSQDQLAAGIANARAQNAIGTDNAMYMRDTNLAMASFAANGDYENAMAGQLAQINDAKISPNSVIGSYGGEAFNIINDVPSLVVRVKTPDDATIRRIGDYWLRFGYAMDLWIDVPESLMAMSKFTYWKMSQVYMNAAPMPEVFKHGIRGMFEKGVCLWNDPDMIGSFANNAPLEGITL